MPSRARILLRVSLLVTALCGGSAVAWAAGPGGGIRFYAALPAAVVAAMLLARLSDRLVPVRCPACGERMRPPSVGRRLRRALWLRCPRCGHQIAAAD